MGIKQWRQRRAGAPDGSAQTTRTTQTARTTRTVVTRTTSVAAAPVDGLQVQVDGPAESGWLGTAVLRDVADIAVAPGSAPEPGASFCTLTLDVNSSSGTYQAQTRLGFSSPKIRAAIGVPGRVLPVRIDPADPQKVTVDVVEFYRQNPELAL